MNMICLCRSGLAERIPTYAAWPDEHLPFLSLPPQLSTPAPEVHLQLRTTVPTDIHPQVCLSLVPLVDVAFDEVNTIQLSQQPGDQ